MRRVQLVGSVIVLLFGCVCSQAQQVVATNTNVAVPPLVNFSGVLTDGSGRPLTGTVAVTFSLYSEQTGGAALWLESQNVQPDNTGRYTVMLGSTSSSGLPAEIFIAGQAHWLGVQVEGEAEQPRVLLVSAPYALKAGDAQTLGGLPPSAFVLAPASGAATTVTGSDDLTANASAAPSSDTSSDVTTSGGAVGTIAAFSTATNIQNSILTQTGTSSINVAGKLSLPSMGTATFSAGYNSRPLDFLASAYNSSTSAAVTQTFQWQAQPTGNDTPTPAASLSLLFASGTSDLTQTGLQIASDGQITFAKGQIFPGTGDGTITGVTTASGSGLSGGGTSGSLALSLNKDCGTNQILQWSGSVWNCSSAGTGTITGVTAGTGLTGGGTSGAVTLSLNTSTVPLLNAANTFTGTQTINNTVAVTGSNSSQMLQVTNTLTSGATAAISATGDSSGGYAVLGTSPRVGIYGIKDKPSVLGSGLGVTGGIWGDTADKGYTAVNGTADDGSGGYFANNSPSGYATLAAYAMNTTSGSVAVAGSSSSSSGYGVLGMSPNLGVTGESSGQSQTGIGYGYGAGVWGDTGGPANQGSGGVLGTADDNIGGEFLNNSSDNLQMPTIYAQNFTTSTTGLVLQTWGGSSDATCAIDASANMSCSGTVSGVVDADGGARKVSLYAMQSPENWFEDFGSATLTNGAVTVALDPTFASTVNTTTGYHVFLTPSGDCKGLYVSQKSAGSFEVRELGGGQSSISFDYRIVAKRSGYENVRLTDVTAQYQKMEQQQQLRRERMEQRRAARPLAAPIAAAVKTTR